MKVRDARNAIVEAGRWLADRGLAPGSSGNLSVRIGDRWLVTPTQVPLADLRPGRLAVLDSSGAPVGGDPPSAEAPLHLAIYAVRPEAGAAVHLHSTHAVALSCLADLDPDAALAPLTPRQVLRLDPIGVVAYARPGSPEIAAAVRERARRHAVLLLANHGPVVAAPTLAEAIRLAEELEEAAKIAFLLHGRSVRRLAPDEIEDIQRHAGSGVERLGDARR